MEAGRKRDAFEKDDDDTSSPMPGPSPKRRLVTADRDGKLRISVGPDHNFLAPAAPHPHPANRNLEVMFRKARFQRPSPAPSAVGQSSKTSSLTSSLEKISSASNSKDEMRTSIRTLITASASTMDKSADVCPEDLEASYNSERSRVLAGEQFATPLAVLHDMGRQFGARVHFEFHEIKFQSTKTKRFLAEVFVGNRKGYGEASYKKLSAHMAAANLLRKIKLVKKNTYDVPNHYLLPGCRINPSVFVDLKYLCKILDLQQPMYVHIPSDPESEDENEALCTYKCQIGKLICFGASDSKYLARRLAAKNAYEALTGSQLDMDSVNSGSTCVTMAKCNITPLSSMRKMRATDLRQQAFEKENWALLPEQEIISANVHEEKEDGFEEDMDAEIMDEGDVGEQAARRLHRVVNLMTDDVKKKLRTLRIGGGTGKN